MSALVQRPQIGGMSACFRPNSDMFECRSPSNRRSPSRRRLSRTSRTHSWARSPLASTGNLLLTPTSEAKAGKTMNLTEFEKGPSLTKNQSASTGNLTTAKKSNEKVPKINAAAEIRRDLLKRVPHGRWQRYQKGWIDFSPETNAELEKSFFAGESKFQLWDGSIVRDFDLVNMVALPGLIKLQRVDMATLKDELEGRMSQS